MRLSQSSIPLFPFYVYIIILYVICSYDSWFLWVMAWILSLLLSIWTLSFDSRLFNPPSDGPGCALRHWASFVHLQAWGCGPSPIICPQIFMDLKERENSNCMLDIWSPPCNTWVWSSSKGVGPHPIAIPILKLRINKQWWNLASLVVNWSIHQHHYKL